MRDYGPPMWDLGVETDTWETESRPSESLALDAMDLPASDGACIYMVIYYCC
jgi:hypothetical protein